MKKALIIILSIFLSIFISSCEEDNTIPKVTITILNEDGTSLGINPIPINKGTTLDLSAFLTPESTNSDYEFAYWLDVNKNKIEGELVLNSDTTLYVCWKLISTKAFISLLDENGDSLGLDLIILDKGDTLSYNNLPVLENKEINGIEHAFAGWKVKNTEVVIFGDTTYTVNDHLDLISTWESTKAVRTITITLADDESIGDAEKLISVREDDVITLSNLPNPKKIANDDYSYKFNYWSYGHNQIIDKNNGLTISTDVEIKPVFKEIITITFSLKDGESIATGIKIKTFSRNKNGGITESDLNTVPVSSNLTTEGKKQYFANWYYLDEEENEVYITNSSPYDGSKNLTIYPAWDTFWLITHDFNEGSLNGVDKITYPANNFSSYTPTLTDKVVDHYEITYDGENTSSLIEVGDEIRGNGTVKYIWADGYHMLSFVLNGGSCTDELVFRIKHKESLLQGKIPSKPTKDKLVFDAWYLLDSSGNMTDTYFTASTVIDKDMTFKAKYVETVTATYDLTLNGF